MKSFLRTFIPDSCIRLLWHFPKAVCANVLFRFPGKHISCIAVAGTKGKTSTAFFLHHILNASGKKVALFSTAITHDGKNEQLNAWKMTTPDVFALNRFLARTKKNHCIYAVIEVSSHALMQYRVWGILFSTVIITNLLPDHLEYHASAEEYQKVHEKLFSKKTSVLVASSDIKSLLSVPAHVRSEMELVTGTGSGANFGEQEQARERGRAQIREYAKLSQIPDVPASVLPWWFPLQGTNISTAITAAHALGINNEQISHALRTLPCPPGRFESIDAGQKFRIVVDYAHSPESLEYFLSAMRPLVSGKLIVVFGACGDRDKTQRPRMGKILEQYADYIVLTTDDPYSERPEALADDVERGFTSRDSLPTGQADSPLTRNEVSIQRILDRKEAITFALSLAQENDCVCILGKGAEQWQVFKDKKIPWDDRATARALL